MAGLGLHTEFSTQSPPSFPQEGNRPFHHQTAAVMRPLMGGERLRLAGTFLAMDDLARRGRERRFNKPCADRLASGFAGRDQNAPDEPAMAGRFSAAIRILGPCLARFPAQSRVERPHIPPTGRWRDATRSVTLMRVNP